MDRVAVRLGRHRPHGDAAAPAGQRIILGQDTHSGQQKQDADKFHGRHCGHIHR